MNDQTELTRLKAEADAAWKAERAARAEADAAYASWEAARAARKAARAAEGKK